MCVYGLSLTLRILYLTQLSTAQKDDFVAEEREACDIACTITSESCVHESNLDSDLKRTIADSLQDMVPATGTTLEGMLGLTATEQPSEKTHIPWYAPEGLKRQQNGV